MRLFNEAERDAEEAQAELPPILVAAHPRAQPVRKPLPAALPRIEVIHDLSEAEKLCLPGLLAHVTVAKYQDAVPLYRQERILERIGVELPRATLASWMVRLGQYDPTADEPDA